MAVLPPGSAEPPNGLTSVAEDLTFPTSLTFDEEGTAYVAEAGLPFGGAAPGGRIWLLGPDDSRQLLADGLRPPVNGLIYQQGYLYVSEGGHPSRIFRLGLDGSQTTVLGNLPGPGNYQVNMVVFGPDERLYFSIGAMTNAGVVGLDAYQVGWLNRLPHQHDIPGRDVVLRGIDFETPNLPGDTQRADPRGGSAPAPGVPSGASGVARTGAFVGFGTPTHPGQRVLAGLPCTAGVMRCHPDGTGLELVAWGLRNAYGLGFLPDGRLLATDQGADDRGSRPIGDAPDALFDLRPGRWYGWPDFICGQSVEHPAFRPARGGPPTFLLANHDELGPPAQPLVRFPPHTAAVKFDVAPAGFGWPWPGQVILAAFGDERPMTAPEGPRAGRCVVRIDPSDWRVSPFVDAPLRRPIDVRFHPLDGSLHILDFGEFEVTEHGIRAVPGSGALWRRTPPAQTSGPSRRRAPGKRAPEKGESR
jgi:glucose/arabinose dehydrogenase